MVRKHLPTIRKCTTTQQSLPLLFRPSWGYRVFPVQLWQAWSAYLACCSIILSLKLNNFWPYTFLIQSFHCICKYRFPDFVSSTTVSDPFISSFCKFLWEAFPSQSLKLSFCMELPQRQQLSACYSAMRMNLSVERRQLRTRQRLKVTITNWYVRLRGRSSILLPITTATNKGTPDKGAL